MNQEGLVKHLIIVSAVLFCMLSFRQVRAKVVAYPIPADANSADDYRVWVDGQEVFVFNNPVAALASFDFNGQVEVVVEPVRDVKWVDVRPQWKSIRPVIKDGRFSFTLDKPANLSIELNGEILRHPLFLFANPIEKDVPIPDDKGVHYFGPGLHSPGIIDVNSDETVYLAGGAVVEAAIFADGKKNIKICGRGILDGTRLRELRGNRRTRFVQLQNCSDVRIEGITLSNSKTWQIMPLNCDNVTINNVKMVSDNGSDDGMDIVSSRNVKITNCFVHTKDDCVVIKGWPDRRNYPRSGPPTAGPPVKNVTVQNCVFWNSAWGNAIEIGFELRVDEVANVTFRNNDVIHCEDGATFSIHNGDFATVHDITFDNIRVEDSRQKLFDFAIFHTRYSHDAPRDRAERTRRYLHGAWDGVLRVDPDQKAEYAKGRGKIKDITIKNINVVDGILPFSLFCGYDDEHMVENVTINGLYFHGEKLTGPEQAKFHLENAKNIKFVD